MSEAPKGINDPDNEIYKDQGKSFYEESLRIGAHVRSQRTGEREEDILKEARVENLEKHATALGTTLKPKEVAESANNFQLAIDKILRGLHLKR